MGGIAAAAAVDKPGVPVRTVAPDLVDQHLQPERMGPCEKPVEIGKRAEYRVDTAVIGDVVAEILHRRREERRQPDSIDAEHSNMLEAPLDPREIANTVAVR